MATDLFGDEMPEPKELDFHPTPHEFVRATLQLVRRKFDLYGLSFNALDPGAGRGAWGKGLKGMYKRANITGIEVNPIMTNPGYYSNWVTGSYLTYRPEQPFDLIVGNPPYNKPFKGIGQAFLERARTHLSPRGIIVFLMRSSFAHGQDRYKTLYKSWKPRAIFFSVRRPSFSGDGGTESGDTSVYIWEKRSAPHPYTDWLDWDYDKPDTGQQALPGMEA